MTISRPMVLVFLLVILIITSQFEWKQQLVNEMEANPSISQKQQHNLRREEIVKEKIIVSQEKNIQRLNELVQSLQQQLLHCGGTNNTVNISGDSLTANAIEKERADPGRLIGFPASGNNGEKRQAASMAGLLESS